MRYIKFDSLNEGVVGQNWIVEVGNNRNVVTDFDTLVDICPNVQELVKSFNLNDVNYMPAQGRNRSVYWPNRVMILKLANCLELAVFVQQYSKYKEKIDTSNKYNCIMVAMFINIHPLFRQLLGINPQFSHIVSIAQIGTKWYIADRTDKYSVVPLSSNLDTSITMLKKYYVTRYIGQFKSTFGIEITEDNLLYRFNKLDSNDIETINSLVNTSITHKSLDDKLNAYRDIDLWYKSGCVPPKNIVKGKHKKVKVIQWGIEDILKHKYNK